MKFTKGVIIAIISAALILGGAAVGITALVTHSRPDAATPAPIIQVHNNNDNHTTAPADPPTTAQQSAAPAQPAVPAQSDPWAVVSEYYGDITSGDYTDAWNLLSPSEQAAQGSYASFAAGYQTTGSQDVTEISEDAGGDDVSYSLTSNNPTETLNYTCSATVSGGLIQSYQCSNS